MTCEKCYHNEVCKALYELNGIPRIGSSQCAYFRDKDRLLELPCAVGDKVYSIDECSCEDIDGVHTECEFYGYGTDDMICTIPNGEKCPYQYRIVECYVTEMNILMFKRIWGKTAFLTREAAEAALYERTDHGQTKT